MHSVIFYLLEPGSQGEAPTWQPIEFYDLGEQFYISNILITVTKDWIEARKKHLESDDVFKKDGSVKKCGGYGRPVKYEIVENNS